MSVSANRTLSARGAQYRDVIGTVTLITLTILLLEHFAIYVVRPIVWPGVIVSVIVLTPQLLYLFGLWSLRGAFAELAGGELFGARLVRAVSILGRSLIVGGLFSIFLMTNLIRLVEDGRGGFLHFDLSAIVLTVLGGALLLLSHLLRIAGRMKSDLDTII